MRVGSAGSLAKPQFAKEPTTRGNQDRLAQVLSRASGDGRQYFAWAKRVDRLRRDNSRPGERNGRSKLTRADVLGIRRDWRAGLSGIQIAAKYEVSRALISYILRGMRWPHVRAGLDWQERKPWLHRFAPGRTDCVKGGGRG